MRREIESWGFIWRRFKRIARRHGWDTKFIYTIGLIVFVIVALAGSSLLVGMFLIVGGGYFGYRVDRIAYQVNKVETYKEASWQ